MKKMKEPDSRKQKERKARYKGANDQKQEEEGKRKMEGRQAGSHVTLQKASLKKNETKQQCAHAWILLLMYFRNFAFLAPPPILESQNPFCQIRIAIAPTSW